MSTASLKTRFALANGIRIAYEEFGESHHPVVLLVPGAGTQLNAWPQSLCTQLAAAGLRVIRLDNRDIGLSQKMSSLGNPNPLLWSWKKSIQPVRICALSFR